MIPLETLRPLVASQSRSARGIEVVFRCPRTGHEATARAPIVTERGLQAEASRVFQKEALRSAKKSLLGAVRGVLGGNSLAGRVASQVIKSGSADVEKRVQMRGSEVDAAIVAAFETVQDQFRWDEDEAVWVGRDPA